MPDRRDALVRLGQTRMFQNAISAIFDGLIPKNGGEEGHDALHILVQWYSSDQRILKSTVTPHPYIAGEEPGVPVCALIFIMAEDSPPASDAADFVLFAKAGELLHHFWGVTGALEDGGIEAKFEDTLPADKFGFVTAAMEFAKEYVRFSSPDPDVKAKVELSIPDAFDGFERGGDHEKMLFLKIKAFYYGLFGHSLSVIELARLRASRDARLRQAV